MDNKQTEIMNIVKSSLPGCCNGATCYRYGGIPADKFRNASREYAPDAVFSECVGLTDETLFGSAKRGFLFTLDGFYYNGCSSKQLYADGITFKSLSGLYNLSAMNSMLQKLYAAATKKSRFEKFVDGAAAVAGSILEEAARQLQEAQDLADQQENEDLIEVLKMYKSFLKEYKSVLAQLAEYDYQEMDTDDCESFFGTLFRSAAILANDREMFVNALGEELSEEEKETFDATAETLELLNDILEMDTKDHKPVYLRRAINTYHASVEAIIDMFEDSDEDDQDMERYFDKGQLAAGKLQKVMGAAITSLNEMIELGYEEM